MNTIKIYIQLMVVAILAVSCDDTLSTLPDNRTQIDSREKIGELLTGAYPLALSAPFLTPRTDNAADKGLNSSNYRNNTENYFWRDVFNNERDYPVFYWNNTFSAIAQANQALASIDDISGPEQGPPDGEDDEPSLDALRAEALLCRAYGYWMLANIWCKAYDPSTAASDMGLPYLTEPETTLINYYDRGNLEDVYNQIESDIEEALPLVGDDYEVVKYHFNRAAAYTFASRFYLFTGDWEKVIEYSSVALSDGAINIRDWSNDYNTLTYSEIRNRFSSTEEPTNLLLVSGSSLYARRFASSRYQLTTELRDELFVDNHPTGGQWSYPVYGNDLFLNIPKFVEYFRYSNLSAGIGIPYVTSVLLSRDEALLNRAEAYAMLGEFESSVTDINNFLSVKTFNFDADSDGLSVNEFRDFYQVEDPNRYTPFYSIPEDALGFINGIAELKRREFYQQNLRWFDIKRFHLSVVHRDRLDNTFTLTKNDPRRLLQIPNEAVSFGLERNPR